MEFTKTEDVAIRQAVSSDETAQLLDLADIQLAIVGGGVGEVNLE